MKKHQDSIFKEIQHSNIIKQLARDQLLKRQSLIQSDNSNQIMKGSQRMSLTLKSRNSSFLRPTTSYQLNKIEEIEEPLRRKQSKTRCSVRKYKSTTLFDLKIKQMKNIISKVHKETVDQMNQKDQKKITKNGWFLIQHDLKKNKTDLYQKVKQAKKLVKKKIRDDKNNIFVQNSISAQSSPYFSVLHSPRQQKLDIQLEQMQPFYNLTKGGIDENQYSQAISLKQYQKSKSSFYILRNVQDNIKNGIQFKKISLQNLNKYKNGKIMPFVYLKQNKYKKNSEKDKHFFIENNIVE